MGVPSRASVVCDEGLETRRVAVLFGKAGVCRNRHGSEEMLTFSKRSILKKDHPCEASHSKSWDSSDVGIDLRQKTF